MVKLSCLLGTEIWPRVPVLLDFEVVNLFDLRLDDSPDVYDFS